MINNIEGNPPGPEKQKKALEAEFKGDAADAVDKVIADNMAALNKFEEDAKRGKRGVDQALRELGELDVGEVEARFQNERNNYTDRSAGDIFEDSIRRTSAAQTKLVSEIMAKRGTTDRVGITNEYQAQLDEIQLKHYRLALAEVRVRAARNIMSEADTDGVSRPPEGMSEEDWTRVEEFMGTGENTDWLLREVRRIRQLPADQHTAEKGQLFAELRKRVSDGTGGVVLSEQAFDRMYENVRRDGGALEADINAGRAVVNRAEAGDMEGAEELNQLLISGDRDAFNARVREMAAENPEDATLQSIADEQDAIEQYREFQRGQYVEGAVVVAGAAFLNAPQFRDLSDDAKQSLARIQANGGGEIINFLKSGEAQDVQVDGDVIEAKIHNRSFALHVPSARAQVGGQTLDDLNARGMDMAMLKVGSGQEGSRINTPSELQQYAELMDIDVADDRVPTQQEWQTITRGFDLFSGDGQAALSNLGIVRNGQYDSKMFEGMRAQLRVLGDQARALDGQDLVNITQHWESGGALPEDRQGTTHVEVLTYQEIANLRGEQAEQAA